MTDFSLIYQCDIWKGTEGSLMCPSVNAASSWLMRLILPVLFLLLAASKFMAHLLAINKPTSCLGLRELPDSVAIWSRAHCWMEGGCSVQGLDMCSIAEALVIQQVLGSSKFEWFVAGKKQEWQILLRACSFLPWSVVRISKSATLQAFLHMVTYLEDPAWK